MTEFSFRDQAALVTGGGSGIGRAAALQLARGGAHVTVADLSAAAATATCDLIGEAGGLARPCPVDVTDAKAVTQMVSQTTDSVGSIDVLINSAGVLRSTAASDIDPAEWDLVIDVNLKGTFFCCQAVGNVMASRGGGRIVNVASMAGRATSTLGGAHYTSAKAGVLGLTRHLAREWAQFGILVNAVSPGIVDTPMVRAATGRARLSRIADAIPLQRLGTPEDVANLICFLASAAHAAYITGANVDIHGGELIIA